MSQPHALEGSEPPPFGQSKTLFVQEGNPACLLVIRQGEAMQQSVMNFATSLAAFEWCRDGRAGMVYAPAGAAPLWGAN